MIASPIQLTVWSWLPCTPNVNQQRRLYQCLELGGVSRVGFLNTAVVCCSNPRGFTVELIDKFNYQLSTTSRFLIS